MRKLDFSISRKYNLSTWTSAGAPGKQAWLDDDVDEDDEDAEKDDDDDDDDDSDDDEDDDDDYYEDSEREHDSASYGVHVGQIISIGGWYNSQFYMNWYIYHFVYNIMWK